VRRFELYARSAAALGFNAISVDDLAHLAVLDDYPAGLRDKIARYQNLYERIFEVAARHGLLVFVNSDAAFVPGQGASAVGGTARALAVLCERLFDRFPAVGGLILRLGECDGIDVTGDLRSKLSIRTASEARRLIGALVNVFERLGRLLVVRTWTVGVYKIGDLIWNPVTYNQVFGGFASGRLIVSHKYGDTDFFRYLSLNPLIFEGSLRKIVEFQACREYEGFGEFPSFVGYEYEQFRDRLVRCPAIAGIHVWCQTGGWSRFHRLTFLPGSSLWNEINTAVTVKIFREGLTADGAVIDFARQRFPRRDPDTLVKIMRLSDELMKRLWYLPEFSRQTLYFRRTRLPPLLWVFWDTIVFDSTLRRLIRRSVRDRQSAIDEGFHLLSGIGEMKRLASQLNIDLRDFDFQYATFELLALARQYYLGEWSLQLAGRIREYAERYKRAYPHGFFTSGDFSAVPIGKGVLNAFFAVALRTHSHYRPFERAFVNPGFAVLQPLVRLWGNRRFPRFARERAMGIDLLLK
jgi:hypothetical protein